MRLAVIELYLTCRCGDAEGVRKRIFCAFGDLN